MPPAAAAKPIVRPSADYEWRLNQREYGDADAKDRREEMRLMAALERQKAREAGQQVDAGSGGAVWQKAATKAANKGAKTKGACKGGGKGKGKGKSPKLPAAVKGKGKGSSSDRSYPTGSLQEKGAPKGKSRRPPKPAAAWTAPDIQSLSLSQRSVTRVPKVATDENFKQQLHALMTKISKKGNTPGLVRYGTQQLKFSGEFVSTVWSPYLPGAWWKKSWTGVAVASRQGAEHAAAGVALIELTADKTFSAMAGFAREEQETTRSTGQRVVSSRGGISDPWKLWGGAADVAPAKKEKRRAWKQSDWHADGSYQAHWNTRSWSSDAKWQGWSEWKDEKEQIHIEAQGGSHTEAQLSPADAPAVSTATTLIHEASQGVSAGLPQDAPAESPKDQRSIDMNLFAFLHHMEAKGKLEAAILQMRQGAQQGLYGCTEELVEDVICAFEIEKEEAAAYEESDLEKEDSADYEEPDEEWEDESEEEEAEEVDVACVPIPDESDDDL